VGALRSLGAIIAARRKPVAWAVLAAAFAVSVFCFGFPLSSDTVLLWITAALFVSCLGDVARWRSLVRDWLPLYLVLALYDLLRGYASHTLWGPFARPQVWFDTHVFGGVTPTVQLQRWLFDPRHLHVWDYAVWFTYDTHFFASFVVAAILWKVDHSQFKRYVSLFVGLTVLGYVTYVLYPAMPPWLASQTGHLPHTTRIVPVVWDHVGLHQAAALFTGGNRFDNNIAAMPSLHAAYPALICVFFWRRARPAARVLLVFYPLAMAFSLVYGAEHFVIDVFMGWLYVAVTYVVGSKLLDRWQARQRRTEPRQGDQGLVEPTETPSDRVPSREAAAKPVEPTVLPVLPTVDN
jgi:membrane-associated phospholipid phosphatase